MSEISNFITQAQQMGVKIYLQDGQLKLEMPWPIEAIPDPVRYILNELKKRQPEVLTYLGPDQEKYWEAVLTNAYFLHFPKGNGEFEPLRPLHGTLEKLKNIGARISKFEREKTVSLRLEQGSAPWIAWNHTRIELLLNQKEQLNWLLALSAMGTARDYADLNVDLPPEWIEDTLGKHRARIAEFRAAIIKNKHNYRYFRVNSRHIYCLAPCKTGRRDVTELTPKEVVLVAEAQDAGMIPPGQDGARSALKWREKR
ncbi:MAG: hypothetical protein C4589_11165 [Peptococcaceae bacterium]|nr:MAG: hypothetical protein C4589_11165 [Peptococcaceae bacterium]